MELAAAKAAQESILSGSPIAENLRIPETRNKRRYLMVVGINTTFSSQKRRDSVRATWMPQADKRKQLEEEKGIVVRFVIGGILDRAIEAEEKRHGDIMRLDHVEGYLELSAKTKIFFATAVASWDADFYVKVDDDVHVNIGTLGATLASPVLAQKGVRYHEPEYWKFGAEGNKYFRHTTGQLYAISKDLANYISINQDERFKLDGIFVDILSIALPAALALAADPITSLVDTAFVGHLGSVELAAVGVSASVFNLVSKLFNVPLLNITTSFVAEEQALASKAEDDFQGDRQSKKLLPSVSTSLALAATFGVAEAVALFLGSGVLMNAMGIYADSPMRIPAESFLALRAFGAPPIVIALAAQGTFRGFKDTKTPLYAVVAGNLLNAILDAILIFIFDFGIRGAAIATVISEYLIAVILLWKLNSEVLLVPTYIDGRRIIGYLKSGVLLIGRSLAVVVTTTLATSVAAREGPIPMAGHQICIQVWLAVSLLTDALALAGQTLLASGYSQQDYEQARLVIYRVLQIGLVTGIGLGIMLFIGFKAFSSLFSTDPQVLAIAWSGLLFVAGSQPINALAFVIDGLYYGVSDFGFAAYSMVLVGLISSAVILVASQSFGLAGVWTGLFLFMALRVVAGIWRLGTRTGPWKLVWDERKQES